ncbi:hypothetical protein AcV7_004225 [Taiwanofungus camphoratus]|nr:hypothetical protein AcV7_004225 [Antrodia cinnamomea]
MPARILTESSDYMPSLNTAPGPLYPSHPSLSPPIYRDLGDGAYDERSHLTPSSSPHPVGVDTSRYRAALHHTPYTSLDRMYPSVPPSLQAQHYAVPQYRASHVFVPSYSGPLHVHSSVHPNLANPPWHPHVRVHPVLSPPPPITHKVWILDCKSCGTFLTNRGMKAVLLLRPNVPLYSTDALPINCSAYSASLETSASSSSPPLPLPAPPRADSSDRSHPEHPLSRTCECLTQTLCCHGCGGAVGYMIVSPCVRCTSSITANNRTTNGHRFVFYSSEVCASERHYVPGERGVLPFHPPRGSAAAASHVRPPRRHSLVRVLPLPARGPDYLSTAPPDEDLEFVRPARFPETGTAGNAAAASPGAGSASSGSAESDSAPDSPPPLIPLSPPPAHARASHVPPAPPPSRSPSASHARALSSPDPSASASASSPPPPAHSSGIAVPGAATTVPQAANNAEPERLEAGDVLYWHNLVRSGEIPAVFEDPRARRKYIGARPDARSSDEAAEKEGQLAGAKSMVFAGR